MKSLFNKSALLVACLVVSMPAISSTVTVDGIKTAGEYTGTSPSSGTGPVLWWNGHHSIYDKASGNMNPLDWEINDNSGSFSLNVFFEVPTYARRMIWEAGCDSSGTGCTLDQSYLDAYQAGTHHSNANMDYGTQTGSEFFQLNDTDFKGPGDADDDITVIKKIKWQDEDANGLTDNFTWATSREYLIDQGICDTNFCDEYDRTASIEMMWDNFSSKDAADTFLASVTDMELHLSDEARGLPPIDPPVDAPEPSVLALIGLGLVAMGFRRRRSQV